ncbi:translation initiation factor IF-2-like [Hordeum vulgare subsp. vulgare]|uniref:translation initiation factor IF-2-like n=1 Tax=Hordeum vulgare subsp. vulgare TaxID=112509 RepID=UPI001D1A401F|nr:translation initiation factor IF-2-like [Hordeum vulgare subsp. vulgare]
MDEPHNVCRTELQRLQPTDCIVTSLRICRLPCAPWPGKQRLPSPTAVAPLAGVESCPVEPIPRRWTSPHVQIHRPIAGSTVVRPAGHRPSSPVAPCRRCPRPRCLPSPSPCLRSGACEEEGDRQFPAPTEPRPSSRSAQAHPVRLLSVRPPLLLGQTQQGPQSLEQASLQSLESQAPHTPITSGHRMRSRPAAGRRRAAVGEQKGSSGSPPCRDEQRYSRQRSSGGELRPASRRAAAAPSHVGTSK